MYNAIDHARPPLDLHAFLTSRYANRLDRGERDVARSLAREAVDFLEEVVPLVAPAVGMVVLKTLIDAWTTSNNFGQEYRDCSFCGAVDGDNCIHFAVCPGLLAAYVDCPRLQSLPELHWLFLPPRCDIDVKLRVVGYMVAAFNSFNHCKNGIGFNSRIFRSYVDKAMRDCRAVRSALIAV